MRTFFRDKFSDQASIVDLIVIGGRELSWYHGNRDVTKSKDKLLGDSRHPVRHSEHLRCLQGPAGPGPSKLKGDLTEKSNVFYIDVGVPWDVLEVFGGLPRPSVKIRCRAYYHFKTRISAK